MPEQIRQFLQQQFIGQNTVADWCWFAGIIIAGLLLRTIVARLLTRIIFRLFRKTDSHAVGYEKMFELVRKPWHLFLLSIIVYVAFQNLSWPAEWKMAPSDKFGIHMVLERGLLVVMVISFTWILLRVTDFIGLLMIHRASQTPGTTDDQLVPFLRESIKVIVVIISIFFAMGSIFHVNVASLIAGLGIGGIAVALAAKESLENLIASFTIFLDKPFSVGDVVQFGNNQPGVIERIGFRSTRIRAEDSSFVTVPNRKMVESEMYNLSLRKSRMVKSLIGLSYETGTAQLKNIIQDIQQVLNLHEDLVNADCRVSLFEFTPAAINIQVLYFIRETNADTHLRVREQINFSISEIVHKHQAAFAVPVVPAQEKR
ncbi:MAG: mechanosensitive ion channel family protein [Bacteroidia bacterium]